MDAMDALFDGLEMELKPIQELYLQTPGFKDPSQMFGEKEWTNFQNVLSGPEVSSSKLVRGIQTMFRGKVQALARDNFLNIKQPERLEILKQRQMLLVDCSESIKALRSVIKTVLQNTDRTAYQEMHGMDVVDLSHTHIPELQDMEGRWYPHPFDGARFNLLLQQVKEEDRIEQRDGIPRELHLRVGQRSSGPQTINGYVFSKTIFSGDRVPVREYKTMQQTYRESRQVTEVMTIGVESEMVDRALPTLIDDLFNRASESGSVRLEDGINVYHR